MLCGTALLGFGLYKLVRSRHPSWVGMRVNFKDLTLWSFLMASAHGAGLMLTPIFLKWTAAAPVHANHVHMGAPDPVGQSAGWVFAAVGVHTLSFFLVTGLIAVLVYEKLGLAPLRKSWFNLGLL